MSRKPRRHFSEELKSQVVDDYVCGRKTVAELSREHTISQGQIYKWKSQLEEKVATGRVKDLVAEGRSPQDARLLQQKENEIEMYQKKIAEQVLMIDLLKKLHHSENSHLLKSVSGSDEIAELLAQSKKRVRR
jgi:transposase